MASKGRKAALPTTTAEYVAQQPEGHFQEAVIQLARAHGWRVAHFRPVRTVRADGTVRWLTPVEADGEGFPDLCLARAGRVIFAELKSAAGRMSPAQAEWLKALDGDGWTYVWRPDDWGKIEEVLA